MEEIIRKKRIIYISPEINSIIEKVYNDSKEIDISQRYINQYNLRELLQNELKTLNGIDYLVIDIRAISTSTNDSEILKCIHQIKGLYDVRIIFIAQGFQKGNTLLAGLFNKGVYNIITANSDITFEEEFRQAVSEKGISFATASKYEIENMNISTQNNQNLVKQNYIKVKQDVSVGVLGICNHIGTTTCSINIVNFLNSLINIKACFIENNNHNDIIQIADRNEDETSVNVLYDIGKVEYKGLDLYYKPENIGDIRKEKYNFYIYDFGTVDELSENDLIAFLNKDIKILLMSNSYWEEKKALNAFKKLKVNPADETTYYIFNFVNEEERLSVLNIYEDFKNNIYFNEYQPNAFILSNRLFLEKVFKKFFENFEFEEDRKRKKGFFWQKK